MGKDACFIASTRYGPLRSTSAAPAPRRFLEALLGCCTLGITTDPGPDRRLFVPNWVPGARQTPGTPTLHCLVSSTELHKNLPVRLPEVSLALVLYLSLRNPR
ncbi:hypothetical protein LIA77_04024 [Sarocladium implicatum]|nr:hypothetical protein LIA77_04024 [Sarocladium implicatum]